LFDRPQTKFVAGFLGSPKMNFLTGTLSSSGLRLSDGTMLSLSHKRRQTGTVVLGIRPQHISVASGKLKKSHARAKTVAEIVQPTGSRLHVNLPLGGSSVVAEFETQSGVEPGSAIAVDIDMTRAILIDPTTDKVI
jgi:multiple sugar transport system ATP-binding protein